jgi:hypothetical protein
MTATQPREIALSSDFATKASKAVTQKVFGNQ